MRQNNCRIFKEELFLGKRSCIVAVFLFMSLILLSPVTVFAMNEDYLDESKWSANSNVTSVGLNKKSLDNTLSGVFKYYIDNNRNMYMYFSITESSMNQNNKDVRININVKSESESYMFSIDEHGMCDALNEEAKLFDVQQNFTYYSNTDSGLYLAGVHTDISEDLIFEIRLYINGHVYRILDNVDVNISKEATDAASSNTTADKSKKTTVSAASDKGAGNASTVSGTTKFSGTPAAASSASETETTPSNNSSYGEAVTDYDTEEDTAENENDDGTNKAKATLSKTAKTWLGVGSAAAGTGVIVLTAAVITHIKENKVHKSDDKD